MAHLTTTAVDGLLGVLTKAVKDEAKLLGGVEGDIQFIKDEMDSMNGFLVHLTKTTATNHDDQVRAWMKQVRDIAYVADDNIKLYMRDLAPPEPGFWPWLCHRPRYIGSIMTRHRVGKDIKKLKERVREVGKRRLRYGVDLPKDGDAVPPPPADQGDDDKTREEFRRALDEPLPPPSFVSWPSWKKKPVFEKAIAILTCADAIKDVLKDYFLKKPPAAAAAADDVTTSAMKMLLCTLYAYPYRAKKEAVEDLLDKLDDKGKRGDWDVMLFSYGMLSTPYKSCLQYLTTFDKEKSISRTCLVRRWVAEGLLDAAAAGRGSEVGEGFSLEEAGERCFAELVFLGFVSPAAPASPTGLKLKSCVVPDRAKEFIFNMSKTENFVSNLPTHFRHQVEIRRLAEQHLPPALLLLEQQRRRPWWRRRLSTTVCGPTAVDEDGRKVVHPMNEMVDQLLDKLPKEYRLIVIDLGGCQTLRTHYLRKICKLVPSLRYLSLRKTNVHRLPREMRDLLHLETLDIRDTNVLPATLRDIVLNSLKHLLAGAVSTDAIATVFVPCRIGPKTEALKHVQIQDGGDLARVGALERLRKLGVVLDGREDNMALLHRVIARRSDTLRSLLVWITAPPMAAGNRGFVTLGSKRDDDDDGDDTGGGAPLSLVLPEKLESLNLKCFKGNKAKPAGNSIPQCIQGHQHLSKITLRHSLLNKEGLRELGKLKSLRCLKLRHESYMEAEVTLSEGEFPDLRLLVLDQVSVRMTKLVFEARAAPKLEKIVWNLDKTTTSVEIAADNIAGINNLTGLKELNINGVAYPKPFPFSTPSLASK